MPGNGDPGVGQTQQMSHRNVCMWSCLLSVFDISDTIRVLSFNKTFVHVYTCISKYLTYNFPYDTNRLNYYHIDY